MCLYIDAEEHELGDLSEPANYKDIRAIRILIAIAVFYDYEIWQMVISFSFVGPQGDDMPQIACAYTSMLRSMDNEVWDLVELLPNGKTVGGNWLFKKKIDMDGAVHTYKARLVSKGYTQTLGIDYEETFSPIADIRAIRILIAIAAFYDYEIWQMDVRTAFLIGYLSEVVYMEQPKGNHIPMLQDVKSYLGRCFAMKDLGEA
nr:putative retrotransposon Ty1-copia subclass protein [Tanacetum cinerariifolium]